MDESAPHGPHRLRRRDALRLLAASTGAAAGGSLIVSGRAHADVGSEPCLFAFGGSPSVTITAFSTTFLGDFITLTTGAVTGTCGCGGTPTIEYAFHLDAPNSTASTPGWITSNQVSLSFANLWPNAGGPFTVSAGVRVTCAGPTATTIRCRFASISLNMPAAFGRVDATLPLPTDNGNTSFPNLPACDVAALRMAALSSDGGGVGFVPGAAATTPELQALIDGAPEVQPIDVLAEPPPPSPPPGDDAATTTTTSTTTTTTVAPEPEVVATTTPPTTSSTPSATTTPSTAPAD